MRLDHTDDTSIAKTTKAVTRDLLKLRATLPDDPGADPLAVRLVANEDGELWYATGDVSYDTVHGAACGATEIDRHMTDEDIAACASDLVSQVADGLADSDADLDDADSDQPRDLRDVFPSDCPDRDA